MILQGVVVGGLVVVFVVVIGTVVDFVVNDLVGVVSFNKN